MKGGMEFSAVQRERYARQLVLPGFGAEGQRRPAAGSVLIVGAGGLGSPAALYLAAAGVGRIGIVDSDVVELSNLHRQVLHGMADVGRPKTESARETLEACNDDVEVVPIAARFDQTNARALVRAYDLVLVAVDNFPTRYLLNDAAVREGRPVVHGAIYQYEGQAAVFAAPGGPCYRCVFLDPPEPPPGPPCPPPGLLGVLPGVIGVLQATEAIKLLTGIGEPLVGRLLIYDALTMTFRQVAVRRRPDCVACGDSPSPGKRF